MKKYILILIGVLTFGCDEAELNRKNQEALKNPKIIGVTEDGRILKLYKVLTIGGNVHYIYVIQNSHNNNYQSGKYPQTVTTVEEP